MIWFVAGTLVAKLLFDSWAISIIVGVTCFLLFSDNDPD